MASWTDKASKDLEKAAKHLENQPSLAMEALNAALTELQANGWKWDSTTNSIVWGD